MRTPVTFPDPERATKDLVATWYDPEETLVGIGVPTDRKTPTEDPPLPYIQIGWDGTPGTTEILLDALIRVTVWASSTSAAKTLALEVQGRLLGFLGDTTISHITRALGVLPGRDPDTRSELASFAVRVSVRSTPLP